MAGLPMALRVARHGRVAFVEKEKLGGTCLNRGCIPTKTMIASAAVAHQVLDRAELERLEPAATGDQPRNEGRTGDLPAPYASVASTTQMPAECKIAGR